ncbi:glycosyltransferase family 2 protein [Parafrankia sp. FMc2]|uniref:glycosyltransferase family 2 protein n=1 Tax=Parafrankia sp. FMc2 TaxID=3233196 RepID=UPI0034D5E82E
MPAPAVSVICPTYNRSARILPTLRSVQAQTVTDWELLVISDGSTDDTDEVVTAHAGQDSRVRLLRAERQGHPAPVREIGIAHARGGIIAYLDHDDTWLPHHLAGLLDALGAAGAEVAATGAVRIGPDGSRASATGPLDLLWHPELQVASPLFEPSRVAHRAGVTSAVGGWRRLDAGLEDWDLWLRLADAGTRFVTVDARTAVLADGAASRRGTVPRQHLLRLARFPDPARAARAVAVLRGQDTAEALRAAARADQIAWYRDLATAGELRWPHRATGAAGPVPPAAVIDLVERTLASAGAAAAAWPDLVVRRQPANQGGPVVVGLPLWCGTADHAARLSALLRRRQPRQLALTGDVLSRRHDGAPAAFRAGRATPTRQRTAS